MTFEEMLYTLNDHPSAGPHNSWTGTIGMAFATWQSGAMVSHLGYYDRDGAGGRRGVTLVELLVVIRWLPVGSCSSLSRAGEHSEALPSGRSWTLRPTRQGTVCRLVGSESPCSQRSTKA